MTFSAAVAILAAAIVLLLLWMLRGAVLLPVRLGKELSLTLVLRASGSGDGLEQAVRALLWMMENGTLSGTIVIEDAGLSPEAREAAALLQARYDRIYIRTSGEDRP